MARLLALAHMFIGTDNIQVPIVKNLRTCTLPASLRHLSLFDCSDSYTWLTGSMPRLG